MFGVDITPFFLSFKLAAVTTVILFFLTFPLAYFMAFKNFKFKLLFESLVTLPIVMPPTVLGFYLLLFLSPRSFLGGFLYEHFGMKLVFNFSSMVIASCFFCLPFMLLPLKNGMESVDKSLIEASYSLGKTRLQTLLHVIIPNAFDVMLTAPITTFAHTLGAFGIVLMIGGNIPGETRVASIAIYEKVDALDYATAHVYSFVLLAISFIVLFLVSILNKHSLKRHKHDYS